MSDIDSTVINSKLVELTNKKTYNKSISKMI